MSTEYIHELGDSLSTSGSNAGPHVKVIAPEKYKVSGSETYKTISVEMDGKQDALSFMGDTEVHSLWTKAKANAS